MSRLERLATGSLKVCG